MYSNLVGQQEIALTEDQNSGESQNLLQQWDNRIIKIKILVSRAEIH